MTSYDKIFLHKTVYNLLVMTSLSMLSPMPGVVQEPSLNIPTGELKKAFEFKRKQDLSGYKITHLTVPSQLHKITLHKTVNILLVMTPLSMPTPMPGVVQELSLNIPTGELKKAFEFKRKQGLSPYRIARLTVHCP